MENLDFVMSPLLARASGMVIERLNPFLTDFMVARIIDIPAVGGVIGFTSMVNDEEIIEINGDEGVINPGATSRGQ